MMVWCAVRTSIFLANFVFASYQGLFCCIAFLICFPIKLIINENIAKSMHIEPIRSLIYESRRYTEDDMTKWHVGFSCFFADKQISNSSGKPAGKTSCEGPDFGSVWLTFESQRECISQISPEIPVCASEHFLHKLEMTLTRVVCLPEAGAGVDDPVPCCFLTHPLLNESLLGPKQLHCQLVVCGLKYVLELVPDPSRLGVWGEGEGPTSVGAEAGGAARSQLLFRGPVQWHVVFFRAEVHLQQSESRMNAPIGRSFCSHHLLSLNPKRILHCTNYKNYGEGNLAELPRE